MPQTLQYEVVDVFTDRPYAGNPLAVVLDADDLPGESLQAIAREFNLSETAFPVRSEVATYRLRIFTPQAELPFAGHPSVGSAHTLLRLGRIPAGPVVQECGAGLLPVEVDGAGAQLSGGAPLVGPDVDPAPYLAAVGLGPADLADLPVRPASSGLPALFVPVRAGAVAAARLDLAALAATRTGREPGCLLLGPGEPDRAHQGLRRRARHPRGPGHRQRRAGLRGLPRRSRPGR